MSEAKRTLPKGWRWVRLGDVCEIIAGQSPPSSSYISEPKGLPFFQGKADFGDKYPIARVWCSEPIKIAEPGDILISVRAPVGPTNVADVQCCIGRGLSAIRPHEEVETGYVLHVLRSLENQLARDGSGSTFSAITQDDLKYFHIPLPPTLDEQRRIVRLLDAKLGAVARARAAAQAQLAAAQALPAAYLRAVFESDEAKRWERKRLGEFVRSFKNGFGRRPTGVETGPIVLRIADVSGGKIDLSNPRRVSMNVADIDTYRLKNGDALFIRVNGSSSIVGRCIPISDVPADLIFNDHLIRVELEPGLAARFLSMACNHHAIRDYIVEQSSTSAGQLTVNQTILANIQIPYPVLQVQQSIVLAFENRIMELENLETSITAQLAAIDALPPSLLRQAFNGEL